MTQPKRPSDLRRWLVVAVILLALGNLVIWQERQNGAAAAQEATPAASTPARVAESPITLTRPGDGNTPPLDLAGGAYAVSVTTEKPCFHTFTLRTLEGENAADLASTRVAGTLENTVYAVRAGRYYVAAITGPDCPWTLTLTPQ